MIVVRCDGCDVETLVLVGGGNDHVEVATPLWWSGGGVERYACAQPVEHWCPRCTKRRAAQATEEA